MIPRHTSFITAPCKPLKPCHPPTIAGNPITDVVKQIAGNTTWVINNQCYALLCVRPKLVKQELGPTAQCAKRRTNSKTCHVVIVTLLIVGAATAQTSTHTVSEG